MGRQNKKMSGIAFKIMNQLFKLMDIFGNPDKKLEAFNIQKGNIVVDFGCGPGRYIKKCSELVGKEGKVYAVDIHEMAIEYVTSICNKQNLTNVFTFLVSKDSTKINNNEVDIIYDLDMFHHVSNPKPFFAELHRIIKKKGKLYIEDGHQSRQKSLEKISKSALWDIYSQNKNHIILTPKK